MKIEDPKVVAAFGNLISQYTHAFQACESPIEQLFLAALMEWSWGFSPSLHQDADFIKSTRPLFKGVDGIPIILGTVLYRWRNSGWIDRGYLFGQPTVLIADTKLSPPRVDFAMCVDRARVVVELDGHDFHERTKKQARRDKSRDRALGIAGWTVMRFTGSEVWEDADKCIQEVEEMLWRINRGNDRPSR